MKRQFLSLFILSLSVSALSQNWPQWRGPTDNLLAGKGNYPVKFDTEKDLLWKAPLPGRGGSTPVVWNDSIIITCGIGKGDDGLDGVLCFDWSGKQLWQVTLGKQVKGKHRRGNGSCPSAVTDGKRVFVYYKSGTLAALDFDGKVLWKSTLPDGKGMFYSSPVLSGDKLYFCREKGSVYVCKITPTGLEIINKTQINNDEFVATPVLAQGKLLLRGDKNLYCIGKK